LQALLQCHDPLLVLEVIGITPNRNSALFITGAPRSGTSWIGECFSKAHGVRYVYEPFNPRWNSGLKGEISHFEYYPEGLGAAMAVKKKVDRAFLGRQSREQILRAWYRGYLWPSIRPSRHIVVKDPTAALMAEWVSQQYTANVLVILRHPCAVVSSMVGLGWRLSNQRFFAQRRLMSEYLSPYEQILSRSDSDRYAQAAATWCVIQIVLLEQLGRHSDWLLCKYEDLCADDGVELVALAEKCGLKLDLGTIQAESRRVFGDENDPGSTRKVSRDMPTIWKSRLTAAQIDTVMRVVCDFGLDYLYPEMAP